MKFINPRLHGIIDYAVVGFLVASPSLFELSDFVVTMTYALAIIHLILTLLTDFKAGIFKVIPLPVHGIIEFFVGIFLVFTPWIFGFNEDRTDRLFYVIFGFAVLLTFTFTNYKNVIKSTQRA